MAYKILLAFLFIGGLLGWSFFIVTVVQSFCNRQKELDIVKSIEVDIKLIKEEIKDLTSDTSK